MSLNRYSSLHPAPFVEVVEEIKEEIFNPEAGKASDDPFHEDVGYKEEEVKIISNNYSDILVAELREILKVRGLSTKGKKAELISRLEKSDAEATDKVSTAEEQEDPAWAQVAASVLEKGVSKYGEKEIIDGTNPEEI